MSILSYFAVIALLIVVVGVVNEKWLHIQSDIVLIIFSLGISVLVMIFSQIPGTSEAALALKGKNHFDFAAYLLDGVLCFMLFAGSSRVSVTKMKQNIRPIGLLALLGTAVSSAVYGGLLRCVRIFVLRRGVCFSYEYGFVDMHSARLYRVTHGSDRGDRHPE